jgi:Glu-tRNA(Gln) amidotransferase subunit E-like FAD-binding protein
LHQTEALVGIMLAAKDSRARGLLDDLSQDPLAHEIIQRVNNSPYGVKGRARAAESSSASSKVRPHPAGVKTKPDSPNPSIHAAQSVFSLKKILSHSLNLFASPAHQ